jgi:hypothetical protein
MITGKLVGLRAVEKSDLQLMRDWRNNPDFRRNFREVRELNMDNQMGWFQRVVLESKNDFMFIIERSSDKKPIGVCGLVYINWTIRSADFSFYIGDEAKYIDDEGYAEEAARLLLEYGFKTINLHKVWTELYDFDAKKIGFLTKKLNFSRDGLLRDNCFEGGEYHDSHIYSLLESEYLK